MRDRLARATIQYAALTIAWWPVLLVVRMYELVVVRAAHVLPPGTGEAFLRGVLHDLATALWLGVALLPLAALALVVPRGCQLVHRLLLVALSIVSVMFSQYFAVT